MRQVKAWKRLIGGELTEKAARILPSNYWNNVKRGAAKECLFVLFVSYLDFQFFSIIPQLTADL